LSANFSLYCIVLYNQNLITHLRTEATKTTQLPKSRLAAKIKIKTSKMRTYENCDLKRIG